jgi:hypothetical protein
VFVVVGGAVEDRLNLASLRGCASPRTLLRSPMGISDSLAGRGFQFMAVPLDLEATWNSAIPFSVNDGARWAGRGLSSTVRAGIRMRWGPVHANLVPEIVGVQNALFQIVPSPSDSLQPFANPWHSFNHTIDAPLRFGSQPFTAIDPGQSSVEVRHRGAALGVGSENLWWGAGLRSGIVMSNNAAGIPQVYLRTVSPLRTNVGSWEGRALLGVLSESRFFDDDPGNDHRTLSGAVATLRPRFDSNLVVGASRVVFASLSRLRSAPSHLADFAMTLPSDGADEISALFGQWAFPRSGLAINWEWARLRLPSFRELLVAPQHTQGYTLGLQWVGPVHDSSTLLRFQSEFTMLEQLIPVSRQETITFYPSRRVPQGYTQRGQIIGSATGPGSSSQFIATDLLRRTWDAGVVLGRIRWENDAYYFQPVGISYRTHDVSVFAGLRGGATWHGVTTHAELTAQRRLDYLFQTSLSGYFFDSRFDVPNVTLNFALSYGR